MEKVTVRMNYGLYEELARIAQAEGCTISQLAARAIAEYTLLYPPRREVSESEIDIDKMIEYLRAGGVSEELLVDAIKNACGRAVGYIMEDCEGRIMGMGIEEDACRRYAEQHGLYLRTIRRRD